MKVAIISLSSLSKMFSSSSAKDIFIPGKFSVPFGLENFGIWKSIASLNYFCDLLYRLSSNYLATYHQRLYAITVHLIFLGETYW